MMYGGKPWKMVMKYVIIDIIPIDSPFNKVKSSL